MALATYTDLLASVATWLKRDDLTSLIPDFVVLFEAAANRKLRARQMETSTTLTPTSGTATLPSDYLLFRRVTWTGNPRRELEYVEPSWIQFNYPTSGAGNPNVFTIEGSSLKVRPSDDGSLEFDYWQKIPALSAGANWLFSAHPDAYLFGSLAEAKGFEIDGDWLAAWVGRRDQILDEIQNLSNKGRGVGGIRIMGPTP
jgi:hypothetical protein